MTATTRAMDVIRDVIHDNLLTTYKPSVFFDEAQQPFTDPDAKIIFTKQEGRPVDAFIRQFDVEVTLFSVANATPADNSSTFDDALAACDYVMNTNFRPVADDLTISSPVISHVSGPL